MEADLSILRWIWNVFFGGGGESEKAEAVFNYPHKWGKKPLLENIGFQCVLSYIRGVFEGSAKQFELKVEPQIDASETSQLWWLKSLKLTVIGGREDLDFTFEAEL